MPPIQPQHHPKMSNTIIICYKLFSALAGAPMCYVPYTQYHTVQYNKQKHSKKVAGCIVMHLVTLVRFLNPTYLKSSFLGKNRTMSEK